MACWLELLSVWQSTDSSLVHRFLDPCTAVYSVYKHLSIERDELAKNIQLWERTLQSLQARLEPDITKCNHVPVQKLAEHNFCTHKCCWGCCLEDPADGGKIIYSHEYRR